MPRFLIAATELGLLLEELLLELFEQAVKVTAPTAKIPTAAINFLINLCFFIFSLPKIPYSLKILLLSFFWDAQRILFLVCLLQWFHFLRIRLDQQSAWQSSSRE